MPIRRWRTRSVTMIDDDDGDDDHQQDGADVGVIEFADRDSMSSWPMPPAPTKPITAGAAHIDLEAQQRVAGEVRQHLRQHAQSAQSEPSLPPVDRTPSTGFMSMFSTTSANSLPSAPVVWIAMASTPGIGPEAERDDENQREDDAPARSGKIRGTRR